MNKSESINELAAALSEAQKELKNVFASSKNTFIGSSYASLPSVIDSIIPILTKHGLAVTQLPSYENSVVTVETVLMHKSGQWLSGVCAAPAEKIDKTGKIRLDVQTVGSAISYCRRYALMAIACIGQTDDDGESVTDKGNHGNSHAESRQMETVRHGNTNFVFGDIPDKANSEGLTPQYALMNMVGAQSISSETIRGWCEHFKVASIQEMTEQQATKIIQGLNKRNGQ